jgi:hypothetical protein
MSLAGLSAACSKGDVFGVAGEVAEVEAQLVNPFAALDQLLADDLVAFDVELDAGAGLGEAADLVQLTEESVWSQRYATCWR